MSICPGLSGVERSQAGGGGGGVQDEQLHVTQPLGKWRTGSPN